MSDKPRRIKVRDVKSGEHFTGRFIGFIDDEECRAILNTTDAADKIWTSESLDFNDITFGCHRKRFVVVTSDHKSFNGDRVFVSPKVLYMAHSGRTKNLICAGKLEFEITPVEE